MQTADICTPSPPVLWKGATIDGRGQSMVTGLLLSSAHTSAEVLAVVHGGDEDKGKRRNVVVLGWGSRRVVCLLATF